MDITVRTLFVVRVELQKGVVVGTFAKPLDVPSGLFELATEIIHGGCLRRNVDELRAG
jgi:hypothetical protein